MSEVEEFGRAVAAALGDGWHAEPSHSTAAFARHADGRGLFLCAMSQPWSARGRVRVTGEYPHHQAWRRRQVQVTVSMGRDPRAVARDLQRRLLPAYDAEFAVALEAEAVRAADWAEVDRYAAAVLAAVPGSERMTVGVPDGEALVSLRGHGYRHNVRIRSGSDGTAVDMDLRGIPAADAVRMLAALGDIQAQHGARRPAAAASRRRLRLVPRWLQPALSEAS